MAHAMTQTLFLVDVESTSKTPFSGVMTEFGIVEFETRATFHGHIWDFHPTPGIPALPIADRKNPGFTATVPSGGGITFDGKRHDIDELAEDRERWVYRTLASWMLRFDGRPVFVSDNPGFDFMWMAEGFDRNRIENPFGHSSRRIGDLAAGLSGNWKNASGWKKYRKTGHDHNPVNDSLGNAEALRTILVKHGQIEA
jgi:hypothetical protein